jgi:hypothetical protein
MKVIAFESDRKHGDIRDVHSLLRIRADKGEFRGREVSMTRVSWMSTKSPLSTKPHEILRRNDPIAETVRHAENGLIRHICVVPQRTTARG